MRPWARAAWSLAAAFPLAGGVWSWRPWARMSHPSNMCMCVLLLLAWQAVSQYMHTMDGDWEVHTHFLGHTLKCIYIYNKLDNQIHRNSTIPTIMQTKPWLNAWLMSGVCVCELNMLKGQKKQRLVYHPAVTFHIFWPLQYVIHTYSHIQRQTLAHNETWYSYKHIKQTKAS